VIATGTGAQLKAFSVQTASISFDERWAPPQPIAAKQHRQGIKSGGAARWQWE
jgi:hypothetical protein